MIRVLAVLCLAFLAMGQDAKAHHGDHGDHHGHHGEASELVSRDQVSSRTGRVSDAKADAEADAEADADADANPNPYLPYGFYGYPYGGYRYPYGYFGKRSADA